MEIDGQSQLRVQELRVPILGNAFDECLGDNAFFERFQQR
jgi:hypothetical protein